MIFLIILITMIPISIFSAFCILQGWLIAEELDDIENEMLCKHNNNIYFLPCLKCPEEFIEKEVAKYNWN